MRVELGHLPHMRAAHRVLDQVGTSGVAYCLYDFGFGFPEERILYSKLGLSKTALKILEKPSMTCGCVVRVARPPTTWAEIGRLTLTTPPFS